MLIFPNQHHTKKEPQVIFTVTLFCDPPGIRTQDPNIKSVVLYLLS